MRDYVERLEQVQYTMPENMEATYEDVMDSYFEQVDTAKDNKES